MGAVCTGGVIEVKITPDAFVQGAVAEAEKRRLEALEHRVKQLEAENRQLVDDRRTEDGLSTRSAGTARLDHGRHLEDDGNWCGELRPEGYIKGATPGVENRRSARSAAADSSSVASKASTGKGSTNGPSVMLSPAQHASHQPQEMHRPSSRSPAMLRAESRGGERPSSRQQQQVTTTFTTKASGKATVETKVVTKPDRPSSTPNVGVGSGKSWFWSKQGKRDSEPQVLTIDAEENLRPTVPPMQQLREESVLTEMLNDQSGVQTREQSLCLGSAEEDSDKPVGSGSWDQISPISGGTGSPGTGVAKAAVPNSDTKVVHLGQVRGLRRERSKSLDHLVAMRELGHLSRQDTSGLTLTTEGSNDLQEVIAKLKAQTRRQQSGVSTLASQTEDEDRSDSDVLSFADPQSRNLSRFFSDLTEDELSSQPNPFQDKLSNRKKQADLSKVRGKEDSSQGWKLRIGDDELASKLDFLRGQPSNKSQSFRYRTSTTVAEEDGESVRWVTSSSAAQTAVE